MRAQELRIGNYYLYHIVDKLDERGEWDEVSQIDYDDLRIISDFKSPEYKPIPLTEEWLLKFGFKEKVLSYIDSICKPYWGYAENNQSVLSFYSIDNGKTYIVRADGRLDLCEIKYVHQLQNLYFALTGEELIVSSNEK